MGKFKIDENWYIGDNKYQCPQCEKSFTKFGLIGHFYRKHDERGILFLKKRLQNKKVKVKSTKELWKF